MDPLVLESAPLLLWVIFGATSVLSVSLGGLLAYHWFRYGMNRPVALTAMLIYGGITLVLISSLFASTIAIIATL